MCRERADWASRRDPCDTNSLTGRAGLRTVPSFSDSEQREALLLKRKDSRNKETDVFPPTDPSVRSQATLSVSGENKVRDLSGWPAV